MNLTDRFADALGFAERLHRDQKRKGNDIPYVAHLLAVAATILEWGGDEDTAIAGLLHDAVEDQGGMATAGIIRDRYGDRVAELVLACTDSLAPKTGPKAPWEERKRAHLAKLGKVDRDVALVTAADKLHNLTAMVRDVRTHGPQTLDRFAAPGRLTWYYGAMAEALSAHDEHVPVSDIREWLEVLNELLTKAQASDPNRVRATSDMEGQ